MSGPGVPLKAFVLGGFDADKHLKRKEIDLEKDGDVIEIVTSKGTIHIELFERGEAGWIHISGERGAIEIRPLAGNRIAIRENF